MKVTAKGIEIHYALEGDGPVVTLSHALGTNLSMWDEQARALAGRGSVACCCAAALTTAPRAAAHPPFV